MSSASLLESALAGRTWNPKLVCTLTLTLVFLSGALVGALLMDLGIHNRQRPPAFDTSQGKTVYFEHLKKELDLTPAQAEQMETILNDFWKYYRSVLADSKQQVEQLLNEQQRSKFERLLQQQSPR